MNEDQVLTNLTIDEARNLVLNLTDGLKAEGKSLFEEVTQMKNDQGVTTHFENFSQTAASIFIHYKIEGHDSETFDNKL